MNPLQSINKLITRDADVFLITQWIILYGNRVMNMHLIKKFLGQCLWAEEIGMMTLTGWKEQKKTRGRWEISHLKRIAEGSRGWKLQLMKNDQKHAVFLTLFPLQTRRNWRRKNVKAHHESGNNYVCNSNESKNEICIRISQQFYKDENSI